MNNWIKCMACALALTGAASLKAQPNAGDWEFTLGGSGDADDSFNHGGFGVSGSAGYFLTKNFEASVRQSVNYSAQTADDEWSGSTRLAADWHFILGNFVPFVGANVGLDYNEDHSQWGVGPEVGFKYYVHERTFLLAMGEYRWRIDDFDEGHFVFTVGVGFTLGGRH